MEAHRVLQCRLHWGSVLSGSELSVLGKGSSIGVYYTRKLVDKASYENNIQGFLEISAMWLPNHLRYGIVFLKGFGMEGIWYHKSGYKCATVSQ